MTSKLLRLVLVYSALVVSASGQGDAADSDASRFAGKWVLAEVRQIPGKRNLPLSRDDSKLKIEMDIRVSGNELYVDEKSDPYSRSPKYFLDGRGEKNPGFTAGFVYETVTKFSNGKIVIERRLEGFGPDSQVDEQEWSLSPDGKQLEILTRTTNGRSRVMAGRGIETARPTQIFKRI